MVRVAGRHGASDRPLPTSHGPFSIPDLLHLGRYLGYMEPLPSGQYRGRCGNSETILQIEMAKGMNGQLGPQNTFALTEMGAGFFRPHQHLGMDTSSIAAVEVHAVDFVAERLGKCLFHCHFTRHTMNDMHLVPLPTDPSMEHMNMDKGGMHTWIEITS